MTSPTEFVPLEIEAAIKGGALLREHFSKTTQTKYLANTCQSCGAFCGDFYLHDFWQEEPIAPPAEVVLGCVECHTAVAISPAPDGTIWTGAIPQDDGGDADEPSEEALPEATEKLPTKKKPKAIKPSTPPPVAAKASPMWGRCSDCGTSACPATITDQRFFCSHCRGIRSFIPDLV